MSETDAISLNAFASGISTQSYSISLSRGIINKLNDEELEAVIAHELTHIKQRDILIGSIAATLAGAIVMVANMAQWAAMFGGGRSDEEEGNSGGIVGLILMAIVSLDALLALRRRRALGEV